MSVGEMRTSAECEQDSTVGLLVTLIAFGKVVIY